MPDDLDPELLALDDVRRRDDLPAAWRPASSALDDYLSREHGILSGHNGLGLLLALLEREGYAVLPLGEAKAGTYGGDYDEARVDAEYALEQAMIRLAESAGWGMEWAGSSGTTDGASENTVYVWPKVAGDA